MKINLCFKIILFVLPLSGCIAPPEGVVNPNDLWTKGQVWYGLEGPNLGELLFYKKRAGTGQAFKTKPVACDKTMCGEGVGQSFYYSSKPSIEEIESNYGRKIEVLREFKGDTDNLYGKHDTILVFRFLE